MKRNYKKFLISHLFESILIAQPEFKEVLLNMDSGNRIVYILRGNIGKDIKTRINLIDISKKEDEISYYPDNKYKEYTEEERQTKTKTFGKIGRLVQQLLDLNSYSYTKVEIESFVNEYKAAWNLLYQQREIKIVQGEEIRYWYNEKNYLSTFGTLGNSCMRYNGCADFLDIYVKNKNVSLLTVLVNNKLAGRAILWKLKDGVNYLDRIYTNKDSDVIYIKKWASENIKNLMFRFDRSSECVCELEKCDFEFYPYMDSMHILYLELRNNEITGRGYLSDKKEYYKDGYIIYELQRTNGDHDNISHVWSEYSKKWIENKKAVSINDLGYVEKDLTEFCDFYTCYFLRDDVVYNETIKDWIPKKEAIYNEKWGLVLPDMIKRAIIKYVGFETEPFLIWLDINKNSDSVLEYEDSLYYEVRRIYVAENTKYVIKDLCIGNRFKLEFYTTRRIDQSIDLFENFDYMDKTHADLFGIKLGRNYDTEHCLEYITKFIYPMQFYRKFAKNPTEDQLRLFDIIKNEKEKLYEEYNTTQLLSILQIISDWVDSQKFSDSDNPKWKIIFLINILEYDLYNFLRKLGNNDRNLYNELCDLFEVYRKTDLSYKLSDHLNKTLSKIGVNYYTIRSQANTNIQYNGLLDLEKQKILEYLQ